MRYGFVLDQDKCIGCHACTVACKEEHNVPLGVFRTYVKYVEKGKFPDTERKFAVIRCNQCDDAPCMTICPTAALFRRDNGIVDFDKDACIGCKACMQACPYDALYIDPATQTAAKCNYCAHRVEKGMEPACVIVCPEQAIITGDLDNPASRISTYVASGKTTVRKPEKGTRPKVHYKGADPATLNPSLTHVLGGQMWAAATEKEATFAAMQVMGRGPGSGVPPPMDMARTVMDTAKERAPWGWKVWAYLWTKSIAAGAMGIAGVAVGCSVPGTDRLMGPIASGIALVFTALTCLLLVLDLKRPERFYLILTRPNWSSWLVWGTLALMAFSGVCALWFVASLAGWTGLMKALAWPAVLFSAGAAGYSAFLFRQARGRDFWLSPLLLVQLLIAAALAGAATLLITQQFLNLFERGYVPEVTLGTRYAFDSHRTYSKGALERVLRTGWLETCLLGSLLAQLVILIAEVVVPHGSADSRRAVRLLTHGACAAPFWGAAVLGGIALPLALVATFRHVVAADLFAAALALAGLLIYEHLWIKVGQSVPLS
ncbi:MAG: 4Fe-4S dicluster domain-containing protein [Planctomycetota bacterium]